MHSLFLSHLYEAVDDLHAQVLVERKLDELNSARFRDELKQALAQPLNNKELKKRGIDLEKGPAAVHQVLSLLAVPVQIPVQMHKY
jgi:hypothetical protein